MIFHWTRNVNIYNASECYDISLESNTDPYYPWFKVCGISNNINGSEDTMFQNADGLGELPDNFFADDEDIVEFEGFSNTDVLEAQRTLRNMIST